MFGKCLQVLPVFLQTHGVGIDLVSQLTVLFMACFFDGTGSLFKHQFKCLKECQVKGRGQFVGDEPFQLPVYERLPIFSGVLEEAVLLLL